MKTTNNTIGKTIILNRDGKKFIAKVKSIFSDGIGVLLHFNPKIFSQSISIDGKLFSLAFAFEEEIEENYTGFSM